MSVPLPGRRSSGGSRLQVNFTIGSGSRCLCALNNWYPLILFEEEDEDNVNSRHEARERHVRDSPALRLGLDTGNHGRKETAAHDGYSINTIRGSSLMDEE